MSTYFLLGFSLAFLIGMIVVVVIMRKVRDKNKLDERQKAIRGSVAIHSLLFGSALLLINGAVSEAMTHPWLSIGEQNFIILGLTSTYFVTEQVIRGSYFGMSFTKQRLRVFTFVAIIYWIFLLKIMPDFIIGKSQMLFHQHLTDAGWKLMVYSWVAINYSIILAGWWMERRRNSDT